MGDIGFFLSLGGGVIGELGLNLGVGFEVKRKQAGKKAGKD